MNLTRVLFVCLGNICRSPLAEGVFRQLVIQNGLEPEFTIDSAGTGGWHHGEPPDPRSIGVAARNGLDISTLSARKIRLDDFHKFDLILAMDRANLRALAALAPADGRADIHLLADFAKGQKRDIPDPYYESEAAFEAVYAMLLDDCTGLLARLTEGSNKGKISSVT